MEPQQPPNPPQQAQQQQQPPHSRRHPHLHNILPPSQLPHRTANSTPVSSPGLFSPSLPRPAMTFPAHPASESTTPATLASPYLHPLQSHKVRETHKANVEHDYTTGRKLINHYEIIEELGRGVHGKVKLARNLETGENVAIKIIPRFSKKRRLGKVTAMSTQDKSKREIAILKKIRHPNVVALLEIIDDPELKKIYMVLEYAEAGEITWRKKGLPHICAYERRRQEREMRGEKPTPEEESYDLVLERRQALKDAKRAKMAQAQCVAAAAAANNYWSLEHGVDDEDDNEFLARSYGRDGMDAFGQSLRSQPDSISGSKATSRAPSRTHSAKSMSRAGTPHPPLDSELGSLPFEDDMETPGPLRSNPASSTALEGTMYGPYATEDAGLRGRSPSMADSIISHMSSVDYNRIHDPYADDFSYVPCFTIEHARHTFRDTVLGLEYLHYEGVVHRDIKPPNLLQTKDYRVKISDFGVSYFGRPVRDGDETISESEAQDFDNDLELAKTVGTPAFFAPELCYTDLDDDRSQPKVTEQIDVWSLGVTLFCMIYARIPFIGEDEWHMFRKIATEEVYLPRKRLRPVDPATKPNEKSLYTRVNRPPYRDDDELAYEEVDKDLIDLLTKMLIKNPEKRIRLRDVKRHPFVTKGITNVISWLDDTDPSRRTSGRKIQVDDREVARAVVPLTFLERARSAVKKAVGKVMHPRGERAESVSVSSRRRATSSAASSGGDSPLTGMSTPNLRDARRRSIRPDDYFSNLQQPSDHPLTQRVVASPTDSPSGELQTSTSQRQLSSSAGGQTSRQILELVASLNARDDFSDRHSFGQRTFPRHGHHRSVTNAFLSLTPGPIETRTMPPTPLFDAQTEDPSSTLRKARDMRPPSEDSTRARSVDRGLFVSTDKRAEPKVSLSTAVAPGKVHFSPKPLAVTSETIRGYESSPAYSPVVSPMNGYQHGQPQSEPNFHEKQRLSSESDERPLTARRVMIAPESKNQQTAYKPSPLKPVTPTRAQTGFPTALDGGALYYPERQIEPALVPCPPSPGDETFMGRPLPPSREETIATAVSSSSTSMGALAATPLTSPSETASPIYMINPCSNKDVTEQMLAFQSDPSLPALLSSTSSVSADLEGEFLGNPGVVGRTPVIDTTDSLTPPAFAKEPVTGFPLDAQEDVLHGAVPVKLDSLTRPPISTSASSVASQEEHEDGDGEDSDSDEGLTMAKRKKTVLSSEVHTMGRLVSASRRRDTNASVGSTETAKKLIVD